MTKEKDNVLGCGTCNYQYSYEDWWNEDCNCPEEPKRPATNNQTKVPVQSIDFWCNDGRDEPWEGV